MKSGIDVKMYATLADIPEQKNTLEKQALIELTQAMDENITKCNGMNELVIEADNLRLQTTGKQFRLEHPEKVVEGLEKSVENTNGVLQQVYEKIYEKNEQLHNLQKSELQQSNDATPKNNSGMKPK